jgi:alkyl hydroperoxide reductase subunit AhpC
MRSHRRNGGFGQLDIPLLADVNRRVSKSYGVLNANNFPNRGIFLISPQV